MYHVAIYVLSGRKLSNIDTNKGRNFPNELDYFTSPAVFFLSIFVTHLIISALVVHILPCNWFNWFDNPYNGDMNMGNHLL
jgi:hypothetical protein